MVMDSPEAVCPSPPTLSSSPLPSTQSACLFWTTVWAAQERVFVVDNTGHFKLKCASPEDAPRRGRLTRYPTRVSGRRPANAVSPRKSPALTPHADGFDVMSRPSTDSRSHEKLFRRFTPTGRVGTSHRAMCARAARVADMSKAKLDAFVNPGTPQTAIDRFAAFGEMEEREG
ncbi:hypothetical protein FKP32DRAFT_644654 [Trametes sanguinea]|nr:hypothetical protein FKP32DRAFT_644654 [Trametes sanguinea]